ncbi:Multidrug and toxin extrusion protein 2 [Oopsacas minuta]|uniref:Multidrug and toxin extrusion protein n=1 Tax=Oopsacas minuta TaxID=111878 RepID=A0AAV7JPW1_9METZ|nr:Multidrug and toxin extrusion protein 2 [Oopsacas minuta]
MRVKVLKTNWILEEIVFLFALALPTSIECFTEGLQMKLSNIFIGRSSGNNIEILISAMFIGQTAITIINYPIAEGIAIYVSILCSQAHGAKQYKQVGFYFYRALFMSALTCIPVFTVLISIRHIVYLLFQDWELAEYSGSYTDILCFGYPAYLYYKIGIRFLQALNIVWGPVLYLLIGITVNGIIQYILIFQYNTNIQGAAAGYVIGNYLVALLVFSHIQLSHVHKTISHEWSIELISDWYHTARYAVVAIIQTIIGAAPATILPVICIGMVADNKEQLAIYSITFSIWWLISMAAIGFGSGITVRVAHLLGKNQSKRARKAAILDLIIAQLTIVMCTIIVFAVSEPLSHLFTTDANFAKELTWNLRIFSFLLNTDIKLVIQGVMNACCKQGIQTAVKFIFQTILGSVASVLLIHFVEWKALSIYVQFAVTNTICSVIPLLILSCSNWEKITDVVTQNTNKKTSNLQAEEFHKLKTSILNSKSFIVCRYLASLAISVCVFAIILYVSVIKAY